MQTPAPASAEVPAHPVSRPLSIYADVVGRHPRRLRGRGLHLVPEQSLEVGRPTCRVVVPTPSKVAYMRIFESIA